MARLNAAEEEGQATRAGHEAREGTALHVSYTPRILRTMREICEEMGVGEKVVRRWIRAGAPIAVEGDGKNVRYSAESAALQTWRMQSS